MAFQEFELNMIPHGDMPSFYASQYETGRPIIIDVLMGEDAFDCSELFIELHCRKVDDNIVTLEPDSVDGNQVTFVGTEQLFACPGKNLCEVCLYADDTKDTSLGSLNFFIEVEPDPLAGGLTSETQIHDLYQQVEEITQQVIGDDYYDKTEVDDLLDDKADKSTTYTKTQVDSALALKADTATTYTKTQVDNALALKANTADLATVATTGDYDDLTNKPTIPAAQVQSDWDQSDNTKVDYIKNKPDLSVYVTSDDLGNIIYDLLPAGTASGAVANFETEVGGVPLVDCKANIVATGGNGTPDNPNPINGYTEANITMCGVNFFNTDNAEIGTAWNGASNSARARLVVPCAPNTTYYLSINGTDNLDAWYVAYSPTVPATTAGTQITGNRTLTTNADSKYIIFAFSKTAIAKSDIEALQVQVELGSTATQYHAYTGKLIKLEFDDTVYLAEVSCLNGVWKLKLLGAEVDLGDLTWIAFSNDRWGAQLSEAKTPPDNSTLAEMISDRYSVATINSFLTTGNDKIGLSFNGYVICRNGSTVDTPTGQLLYKLATPTEVTLDETEQFEALLGVNNVYSDTNGDTEVQYKDSIQHYIDSRV